MPDEMVFIFHFITGALTADQIMQRSSILIYILGLNRIYYPSDRVLEAEWGYLWT